MMWTLGREINIEKKEGSETSKENPLRNAYKRGGRHEYKKKVQRRWKGGKSVLKKVLMKGGRLLKGGEREVKC